MKLVKFKKDTERWLSSYNTEKCYNYRKIQIFKRSPYTNDSISKQTIVGWCAYAKIF